MQNRIKRTFKYLRNVYCCYNCYMYEHRVCNYYFVILKFHSPEIFCQYAFTMINLKNGKSKSRSLLYTMDGKKMLDE